MARFLIVYGSEEGQTEKITNHLKNQYEAHRHEVDLVYGKAIPVEFSIADYDGVIVGASIHMGRHQKYMINFARRFADELSNKFSAFFTVCLTARSDTAEDKAQVEQYVEDFIDATNWYPDQIGVFAGALLYTKYGLIKRFIMKSISKQSGASTDMSRDYEYTDWESVDDFGDMFLTAVAGEPVLVGD